jgi:alpha-1,2-mannosyltransferase
LILIGVPWLLSFAQPSIWQHGRAWYLAWGGMVYIVAALATLLWIAVNGRRRVAVSPARPSAAPTTGAPEAAVPPGRGNVESLSSEGRAAEG